MDELGSHVLEIRLTTDESISSGLLIEILSTLNEALLEVELVDLSVLREEFSEIPNYVYESVAQRLYRYSGDVFRIRYAQCGSIILGGAATGLCIWLLSQTLGETIKEAWLESDLHRRIKNALTRQSYKKGESAGRKIKQKLKQKGFKGKVEIEMVAMKIVVTIPVKNQLIIPETQPDESKSDSNMHDR